MATAKTEILTATEIDGITGEVVIRPLSTEEQAQRQTDEVEAKTYQAKLEAKESARASALAKLKELGLTEAEIAAL